MKKIIGRFFSWLWDLFKELLRNKWFWIIFPSALISFTFLGVYMSHQVPREPFEISLKIENEKIYKNNGETAVKGQAFAWTMAELIERELDWGWFKNDLFWPTALLDNRPAFQLGVLEILRADSIALLEQLSRLRTTDARNPLLADVRSLLHNDAEAWIYPAPELKYGKAVKLLKEYEKNLALKNNRKAFFSARSDNLIYLLEYLLSIMGGANTRLVNAPNDIDYRPGEETAGDPHTKGERLHSVETNWWKTDNNFFYAKGVAWGVYHTLLAVKIDFYHVLADKNCLELVDATLFELARCIKIDPIYVCNGKQGGFWPNHSSNLSSPLNEARQKIGNLIKALEKG